MDGGVRQEAGTRRKQDDGTTSMPPLTTTTSRGERHRPRKNTVTDPASALSQPGSVKINVQGAFIVEGDYDSDSTSGANTPAHGDPGTNGNATTRDIRLPHQASEVSHIAVDIGGTLAKLVYFTRDPNGEGGRLTFTNFETDRIDELISFMAGLINKKRIRTHVLASGLGQLNIGEKNLPPSTSTHNSSSTAKTPTQSSPNTPTDRSRPLTPDPFSNPPSSIPVNPASSKARTTSGPPSFHAPSDETLTIMATGGGAYKFYDLLLRSLPLPLTIHREDEMECLIVGLDFFLSEIPDEVFAYNPDLPAPHMAFQELPRDPDSIYPYLLVNIGSGVSMIKVNGRNNYQRIGGSSLGGGTLWGLLSILTNARSFDEMLSMAETGDNTEVDMLVGDIYGGGYGNIGLKATTIASSFGKVFKIKKKRDEEGRTLRRAERRRKREAEDKAQRKQNGVPEPSDHPSQDPDCGSEEETDSEDSDSDPNHGLSYFSPSSISRSLLYAVSNNIGQIAHLHAHIHDLPRIYFGGSFIRGHVATMNTLSYAIKFWSGGKRRAYFLRHEGYLGAVGAFLKRQPRDWGRRGSMDGGTEGIEWPGKRLREEMLNKGEEAA